MDTRSPIPNRNDDDEPDPGFEGEFWWTPIVVAFALFAIILALILGIHFFTEGPRR